MRFAGRVAIFIALVAVSPGVSPSRVAAQTAAVPLALDGDAAARPWRRYPEWPQRDSTKFNTLAALASPPAPKEPRKLTRPITGDPALGAKLAADRTRGGSCLACHVMGAAGGADLPGNLGPDLSEIGNANSDDETLYNFVNDARVYVPDTLMPPWGTHGIFSDEEIGHIVAFLKTLKAPAPFKSELDDPTKRPPPVEKRDNLDAMLNPAMWAVEDKAPVLWKAAGPAGAACATCHRDPVHTFKAWAATMPRWEPRLDKALGIEEFVARHAKAATGHVWPIESQENVALAVYLRFLADGATIAVDTASAPAKAAYARGEALSRRKVGQLNFACVDCHGADRGAGKWIRGQWLGQMRGALDHYPTWRTSLQATWDLRKRFQWCQVAVWANELAPDANEYGDLELYLTAQSNGLKLNVPGIRH